MKFALYRLSHKAWFIHHACAVLSSFLIGFNRSMTEARTIKSAVKKKKIMCTFPTTQFQNYL